MDKQVEVDGRVMIVPGRDGTCSEARGADMAASSQATACEVVIGGDDWLPAPGEKVVIRDIRVDARHPRGFYVLTRIG